MALWNARRKKPASWKICESSSLYVCALVSISSTAQAKNHGLAYERSGARRSARSMLRQSTGHRISS